jgi:hypothetical protein
VQLFTVSIALNGTSGALVNSVSVSIPDPEGVKQIAYFFTYNSLAYLTFIDGTLMVISPSTGAILSTTAMVPPSAGLMDGRGSTFDPSTGIFYANAQGSDGFYLHSFNVVTNATTKLGPLPPAPGTAGPNNARVDSTLASMVVYPPAGLNVPMRLIEMRNSSDFPYLFLAWLDPANGTSTQIAMPNEWYDNWDIDPNIFPDQWPGSERRVWSVDPVDNLVWFKLYDECGGSTTSDCDENELVAYLEWMPGDYVDFYVAVEPIEPELTQLIWVWTNVVH